MLQSPNDLIEGKVYYFSEQETDFVFERLQSRAAIYAGNLPQADIYVFRGYPIPGKRDLFLSGEELQNLIDDQLITPID